MRRCHRSNTKWVIQPPPTAGSPLLTPAPTVNIWLTAWKWRSQQPPAAQPSLLWVALTPLRQFNSDHISRPNSWPTEIKQPSADVSMMRITSAFFWHTNVIQMCRAHLILDTCLLFWAKAEFFWGITWKDCAKCDYARKQRRVNICVFLPLSSRSLSFCALSLSFAIHFSSISSSFLPLEKIRVTENTSQWVKSKKCCVFSYSFHIRRNHRTTSPRREKQPWALLEEEVKTWIQKIRFPFYYKRGPWFNQQPLHLHVLCTAITTTVLS